MKTLLRLSPTAFAALALFGCDQLRLPPATAVDGLSVEHVGGHLGSYRDCPEEAWENQDAPAGEAADRAAFDAICEGSCGPLNCEAARLTVNLINDSDVEAEGVEPVALFLLDREGIEAVELPIAAVFDTAGDPFDGHLGVGEQALVHIEFMGPLDVIALIGPPNDADGDAIWRSGAQLRLSIGAQTHDDTGLDTPPVYSLPEVDT